ncbi:hypothetical protein RD1_2321 [Roseobacter denitrificans OCh 114]|uniref:Uncharacterized protein n=1 Tax=Roseobacter denitrificans (strain ATCC 33942 / OCh 114) TaxID=375451 RepID=Q167E4_ROSDO|nr:hypothetical protein RD1_2321 [Roseobacter denitrificans OCh 114]
MVASQGCMAEGRMRRVTGYHATSRAILKAL